MSYRTPILLLLYNRPETTEQVFAAIREVRPARLFVAADGPSTKRPDDLERCLKTRGVVARVDWDCEVRTLFREENLGCRKAISSAIHWFFEQAEAGIILEDDCLPSSSFFRYCDELLDMYRDCDEVMAVSGDNFQDGRCVTSDSYYFSRYPHCWGWATWRRAWSKYDTDLKGWAEYQQSPSFDEIGATNPSFRGYWTRIFEKVKAGEIDSWAYVWTLSCWLNGGLTAIPRRNLVKNIGFGPDATHTKGASTRLSVMRAEEIEFPLKHPTQISRHASADSYADIHHFGIKLGGEETGEGALLRRYLGALARIFGR